MKKASTGVMSGCVVWVILIFAISSCIIPMFFTIGSITSFTDFAITTTGKFICPENTTPKSNSYQSTRRDDYGRSRPTTAYELQCVDSNGKVAMTDPIIYAFVWDGIFGGVGLIVAVILAFAFAAPAGVFIAKLFNRNKKTDQIINIEL